MSKGTIILRADGNSKIGMGHLMRSLALIEILGSDYHTVLATRFLTDEITEAAQRIAVSEIRELPRERKEAFDVLLTMISGEECVILDNYYFTEDDQRAIKERGAFLVCIDDLADKHFSADVVINPTPGVSRREYSCDSETTLLTGFPYRLLRKPFRDSECRRNTFPALPPQKILLSLGGADPFNITAKATSSLLPERAVKELHILLGGAYTHKAELQKLCSEEPKVTVHIALVASMVRELMASVDLAIVPASTVALELLSVGTPFIVGYFADNQKHFYRWLTEEGGVPGAGDFFNPSFKERLFSLLRGGDFAPPPFMGKEDQNALYDHLIPLLDGYFMDK